MESLKSNNPLVTISVVCYNQEWCVREALEGAFAQTYSPLEIVILDDHSPDRTWEIIQEMTEDYRRRDGKHSIILHRFDRNTYTAPEEEKPKYLREKYDLWRGELIVQSDGDDISLPNRVEEIVKEWNALGQKPDLLMSGSFRIDQKSKNVGIRSCYDHPSGSAMAYTNRMEKFFGLWNTPNIYGDEVRFFRAQMLGGVKLIDKPLLKYRVCGGVSQVLGAFRVPMVRQYTCLRNSRLQSLKDVEIAKKVLSEEKYRYWKAKFQREYYEYDREMPLWESDDFCARWKGYLSMPFKRRFCSGMVVYAPLLLIPHCIGDPILNLIHKVSLKIHLWRGR